MLTEIILATLLALPLYRFIKYLHFVYFYQIPLVKDIYGPPALPIIGNLLHMPRDVKEFPDFMLKYGKEAAEKGVSVMKFWVGPMIVVLPVDHEAVKVRSFRIFVIYLFLGNIGQQRVDKRPGLQVLREMVGFWSSLGWWWTMAKGSKNGDSGVSL